MHSFRTRTMLAVLVALGVLAAACGGGDDGGGGTGGGGDATAAPTADPDEGATPLYGGKMTFLRESETRNAWIPADMQCDSSCHQAIGTVIETLVYLDENDETQPFLLESIESNEDFTTWTLTTREGIEFHDGTPLDADALIDHFDRALASALLGRVFANVADHTKVDDRTIEISMIEPWAAFPTYLIALPGRLASPTWLAAVDAGDADPTEPVGTGPFVFEEYRPNDTFRVVRNDDYWLSDADGNPYPYLDEIEFLVQEDDAGRERAILAGDVDATHTDKGATIDNLRGEVENGNLAMYEMADQAETSYALINVADEESPAADVRIRRAMAMAIDQELRNQSRTDGVFAIANGPFPPGRDGYLEDNGWPAHDPEGARALVEEYKADTGVDEVEIQFNTTADPDQLLTVQLLQGELDEVGINAEIAQVEQGQAITNALTGLFEMQTWRRHGGVAVDAERPFWHSESSGPVGDLATNFGRIEDDVIDDALDTLRGSGDPDVVDEAAQTINERFAEQVYNIWFDWVFWAVPHQPRVHGLQTPVALPDGGVGATRGVGGVGVVSLHQVWVDDAEG